MLMMSRVCALFHDRQGNFLFEVTPATRNCFVEAPEAIQEDPLFQMLLADGSLEAGITKARQRTLEQDPMDGADATGKRKTMAKATAKADAAPAVGLADSGGETAGKAAEASGDSKKTSK